MKIRRKKEEVEERTYLTRISRLTREEGRLTIRGATNCESRRNVLKKLEHKNTVSNKDGSIDNQKF
jgi:hypothetical protein